MLKKRNKTKKTAKEKISRHRKAITLWRGKRSAKKERVERVYSQRWETKTGVSPMVVYKPYQTQQLLSLESTAIQSQEYDPKTRVLRITFWGYKQLHVGHTYAFYDVPQHIWVGLNEASSKGRFFNYMIKGNYSYSRLK